MLASTVPVHAPGLPGNWATAIATIAFCAALAVAAWTVDLRRTIRWKSPEVVFTTAWIALVALGALRAPFPVLAFAELTRFATGFVLFLIGRAAFQTKEDRQGAITAVVGTVAVGAFLDMARYGITGSGARAVRFDAGALSGVGTHETIGTALALVLPFLLPLATLRDPAAWRRLVWQTGVLVIGFAWVLARCRTAWIGGVLGSVAAVVLARGTLLRSDGSKRGLARWLDSPATLLGLGLLFLILAGGVGGAVGARWSSLFEGSGPSSLAARVDQWKAAWHLARESPWIGSGPGTYAVRQGLFTHAGSADWEVLRGGADLSNNPHSLWMQTLAEFGAIGCGLLLAMLVAWGTAGWMRARAEGAPIDRAAGAGMVGLALIVGISGLASPAFAMTPVWALAGLLAGYGTAPPSNESKPGNRPVGWMAGAIGVLATGILGAVLPHDVPWTRGGLRGTWELVAEAPAGIRPGQAVSWTARFTDANGRHHATFPGTTWERPWLVGMRDGAGEDRKGNPLDDTRVEVRGLRPAGRPGESTLRVSLPEDLDRARRWEVWVEASYRDSAGRVYRAVAVGPVGTGPISQPSGEARPGRP